MPLEPEMDGTTAPLRSPAVPSRPHGHRGWHGWPAVPTACRGKTTPPLRCEIFGPERLEAHARSLAAAQTISPRPGGYGHPCRGA
ncbi:hypothetical protein RAA17_11250 [Komagataeibacter rhaeticus]|nr:hypothetical protein [Komagataeibacter rhaeticus]